jgi:hypothetical protein
MGLLAVGLNIKIMRCASMFSRVALELSEIVSSSTPVNSWRSASKPLNLLLPDVSFYWTPHIVFYLRQFTRSFDFLSISNTNTKSSLAKGTPSDASLSADSRWLKTLPRVLFIELYIHITFYSPTSLLEDLQVSLDFIECGESGSLLLEMSRGIGSAA